MKQIVPIVLLAVLMTGCDPIETTPMPKPKQKNPEIAKIRGSIPANRKDQKAWQANADFSIKLLKQLAKENAGKNFAVSPISLSQDFAMLYECSKGFVHDAVADMLGVNGLGPNDLAAFHSRLLDDIEKDPLKTLTMANGLWLSEQYKADVAKSKEMEARFGCTVKPLLLDRPQAKKELDQWAVDNTDGMIKEIVSELDPETAAMFLNTLVFRGKWSEPFDESETKPRDFYGFNGTIKVTTIRSSEMQREAAIVGPFTGLRLTFMAKDFSMLFIVPADKHAFEKLPDLISASWLDDFTKKLSSASTVVSLPKLEISSKLNLIPTLKSMGGGDVFKPGLDLSPLIPRDTPDPRTTYIDTVFQQVKMKLDETGVKAAAMTEINVHAALAMRDEPINVYVDRPFYYFVMHGKTIVLCGAIVDPTKE